MNNYHGQQDVMCRKHFVTIFNRNPEVNMEVIVFLEARVQEERYTTKKRMYEEHTLWCLAWASSYQGEDSLRGLSCGNLCDITL